MARLVRSMDCSRLDSVLDARHLISAFLSCLLRPSWTNLKEDKPTCLLHQEILLYQEIKRYNLAITIALDNLNYNLPLDFQQNL